MHKKLESRPSLQCGNVARVHLPPSYGFGMFVFFWR